MTPENWIAMAGIVATTIVAVATMVINRLREKQQQARDDPSAQGTARTGGHAPHGTAAA